MAIFESMRRGVLMGLAAGLLSVAPQPSCGETYETPPPVQLPPVPEQVISTRAMLDYAVRRDFYHRGHVLLPTIGPQGHLSLPYHRYDAETFFSSIHGWYHLVVHLSDGVSDIELIAAEPGGFPERLAAQGATYATVDSPAGHFHFHADVRAPFQLCLPQGMTPDAAELRVAELSLFYTKTIDHLRIREQMADAYRHRPRVDDP